MDSDRWASWLLRRRDGGDADVRRDHHPSLLAFRDGVLGRAAIAPGDVVLDVGAGTGLIGLGALDRVGPSGRVVFSDISNALLDVCREAAGEDPRCSFVRASADDLAPIPDASVDVVTTRSVIMYVADKPRAFRALARVLRPGGRLSVFEPINSFDAGPSTAGTLFGLDLRPVADLVDKVLSAFGGEEVMLDFDERDLLTWAAGAGFTAIELDYRAEVDTPAPPLPGDWDAMRRTAPNPLAPTYEEAMAATLTAAERRRLESHIRSQWHRPAARRSSSATAYLKATKP